jgi:hypothetical protein
MHIISDIDKHTPDIRPYLGSVNKNHGGGKLKPAATGKTLVCPDVSTPTIRGERTDIEPTDAPNEGTDQPTTGE